MPSWATSRSSRWVAGRASRAVARKRSRPAAQARAMASRRGGRPVESSQRTRVTTARAMCRARRARRRSSSSSIAAGISGWLGCLDSVANSAMASTLTGCGVLLHEVENPLPGVLAGPPVLGESAIEEGVGRVRVDVHLVRDPGRAQLLVEALELLLRREVVARDQQQQRCLHLRDHLAHPRRHAAEADSARKVGIGRRLPPGLRPAEAEADRKDAAHTAALLR